MAKRKAKKQSQIGHLAKRLLCVDNEIKMIIIIIQSARNVIQKNCDRNNRRKRENAALIV